MGNRRGLKMPDLRRYARGFGGRISHVQAMGVDFERGRDGRCAQWLHQVRADLGRLAAIAEVLQIGSLLSRQAGRLASQSAR
jgi:hypothetical protein